MSIEDEPENTEKAEEPVNFAMSLSTEGGRFFRRTCPACGRDFKTEVSPGDLEWAVAPTVRRMGVDIGVDSSKKKAEDNYLYCPYCDHKSLASETITDETRAYLHRLITRELVLPMVHKAFRGLDNFSSPRGGFFSVEFRHERSILPPRPIHGPELPDMRIVEFLCCGEKIKVSEAWTGVKVCTFCGTPVVLV
jgi:hypothetical protein